MAKNKYQKTKKQYSEDGINWYDVEPPEYNIGVLLEENSVDCGYQEPQYRWYALTDTETDYVCDGYNKYYKEVYQVSDDGGKNWINVYPEQSRRGSLIEENSYDCDYGVTWELMNNVYICEEWTEPVIPTGKSYLEVVFANNHDDSLITVQVDDLNILNYVDSHTPIGIKLPVLMPDGYYRVMSLYNLSKNNNEGTNEEEDLSAFKLEGNNFELIKKFYGIEPLYNSTGGYYYGIRGNFINPVVAPIPTWSRTYGCNISEVNYWVNDNDIKHLQYPHSSLAYDVFQTTENALIPSRNEAYIECNEKLRYWAGVLYYNATIAFFDTEYNLNYECMKNIDAHPKNEEHFIYYDNYLTNNILSYHEGEKYTDLIIEQFEDTNLCAKLSREYHTRGTNAGDWFLPSALELGIAASLVGKIKNTIELLNINYNTSYPFFNYQYYTSTPSMALILDRKDNTECYNSLNSLYCFIKLPPTTDELDQYNRNNTRAPSLFYSNSYHTFTKIGARAFTKIK